MWRDIVEGPFKMETYPSNKVRRISTPSGRDVTRDSRSGERREEANGEEVELSQSAHVLYYLHAVFHRIFVATNDICLRLFSS